MNCQDKWRYHLKKEKLENSVKHQIHQILRITRKNGKTEHCGRTYAKNDVVLEPGQISDTFEFREPVFYKIVTMVTRDDDSPNIYTVPVGKCNLQTSADDSKYQEIHHNELVCTGESISKK